VLQEITAELSSAVTLDQVAEVVVSKGVAALGGHIGTIMLLSEDGQTLELLSTRGASEQAVNPYMRFPLEFKSPLSDAARTGLPLWIETLDEYTSRYPHLAEIVQHTTGTKATISLPLIINQRVIGSMGISFAEPRRFSEGDRALLIALVQQCAQALDRARLYEVEAHARAQAEAANELKMRFLAMISHELRTPLTSIKGFATTLLAEDVTWDAQSQREFLMIMDEESDKLKELIEQLLDVSRLQSGTLRVNTEPQPLSRIVERALTQLQTLTADHTFELQLPDNLPPVLADEQRIAQVLVNLVDNASKYSPPQTRITIAAQQAGQYVQVDVSDEGEGIPAEDRSNVFEAFHQVERKSQSQMGAGLGLAICKGLIEAHGGRIWIQDGGRPGTTISFTLPVSLKELD
ncbi:MAG: GAF domain-containing protein, partial [Burkholderiales bacterium]|nr:GAF domain-containing protein [Anaerolineae bacterium]